MIISHPYEKDLTVGVAERIVFLFIYMKQKTREVMTLLQKKYSINRKLSGFFFSQYPKKCMMWNSE